MPPSQWLEEGDRIVVEAEEAHAVLRRRRNFEFTK